MQFTGNIPENDEQHFLGVTLQGSTSELHGQLCYTSQNDKKTQGMND